MSAPDDNRWHLDKRVPLALIATIAIQTGGGIWWASGVDTRVGTLERDVVRVQVEQQRDRDNVAIGFRDLRIWLDGRLGRLEDKLDRKADKQ